MGTPLYTTDIIPLTSRPTLTVMDDGDYFVILDTSTGKISKILRTDAQKALNIIYDNTTSGLTAAQVQAALDELVVNLGSSDSAISALATRVTYLESVRGHLYGVRMEKSSGICTPTYDAIGLQFRPQVDTIGTPSDFSSVYPWRDIKTVKVDADKNILCTIDDASFESTIGDIMVKIPVFWHRYWTDANYEYYEISDTPRDGLS